MKLHFLNNMIAPYAVTCKLSINLVALIQSLTSKTLQGLSKQSMNNNGRKWGTNGKDAII